MVLLLLLVELLPIGVISCAAGTILQIVLDQLALGVVQPAATDEVVIIQLVQLLLLPKDLLLRLGMWLLLLRLRLLLLLLSIMLILSRGVATYIIVVVILLTLIGLFLFGPLQYKLHIAGVFAPFHENFQRVLVGCQQPFVVAPSFDEGESAGLSGGVS